ncbi:MAG: hypothetical protein Kow00124_01210 [Anaerolineae bacterium]
MFTHRTEDSSLIYHVLPLRHGGDLAGWLDEHALPPLPPVDPGRACVPLTPGLPPFPHIPLLPPRAYQLVLPQATDYLGEASPAGPNELAVPLASLPPSMAAAMPGGAAAPAAGQTPVAAGGAADDDVLAGLALDGIRFDPLFAYLIYLGLGFGTLYLGVEARYTVLWTALALGGMILTLVNRRVSRPFLALDLAWGMGIGVVFSLPLLILNWRGLAETARVLFPFEDRAAFFYAMVFVAPLAETLFFRGVMQSQRGFAASVIAVGLSSVLFYWPAAAGQPAYLIAAVLVTTVLAAVYSFFSSRFGLVAAWACQVTINLMLLFIPALLAT